MYTNMSFFIFIVCVNTMTSVINTNVFSILGPRGGSDYFVDPNTGKTYNLDHAHAPEDKSKSLDPNHPQASYQSRMDNGWSSDTAANGGYAPGNVCLRSRPKSWGSYLESHLFLTPAHFCLDLFFVWIFFCLDLLTTIGTCIGTCD